MEGTQGKMRCIGRKARAVVASAIASGFLRQAQDRLFDCVTHDKSVSHSAQVTAKTSNDVEQATTKYRDSGLARMTISGVLLQNVLGGFTSSFRRRRGGVIPWGAG